MPLIAHPSAPEPSIPQIELDALTLSVDEDEPRFPKLEPDADGWAPLAMGCATLGYGIYAPTPSTPEELAMPLRTVRLALEYGVNVFDTSPHYHPSEIVLGNCLRALRSTHPRTSYKITSKCGQFSADGFDYSPETVERSVRRSLVRLGTEYLDVVYLHDVEFIAAGTEPFRQINKPLEALPTSEDEEAKSLGQGDEEVLAAYGVLVKLRAEGLIREIGLSGYPLPVLLRLTRLITARYPATPIGSLISYSHSNLANSSFSTFAPLLIRAAASPSAGAKPLHLLTASPLNMGLLAPSGPPDWHPAHASPGLVDAAREAGQVVASEGWDGGLVDVAFGFGLRNLVIDGGRKVTVVAGVKNVRELHEAVRVWREVNLAEGEERKVEKRKEMERKVREVFVRSGWEDASWASPPPCGHK